MAAIDWPASLPQKFIWDSYNRNAADNTLRSKMDIGPDKVRRRSSAAVQLFDAEAFFTSTQLATFKTWYEDTILDGSLRFNCDDPDDGVTSVEMRFRAVPSWRTPDAGTSWFITLPLEILP